MLDGLGLGLCDHDIAHCPLVLSSPGTSRHRSDKVPLRDLVVCEHACPFVFEVLPDQALLLL
eukprot:443446-Lingulodinium_polyedra.AAC.1